MDKDISFSIYVLYFIGLGRIYDVDWTLVCQSAKVIALTTEIIRKVVWIVYIEKERTQTYQIYGRDEEF